MAKILIVDDEESIRFTFKSFLSDAGHDVITAGDFDDALGKVFGNKPDMIFMDIVLGGKSGIHLLQKIRENNIRCPVVMITGYPNVDTASDAVRLGAFDYIFKPVHQETLLHAANMALQHKVLQDEKDNYRANLEAIFRSVKDAIITVNGDMVVLEVNDAAKKICGIGREAMGKPIAVSDSGCNCNCFDVLKKTISEKKAIEVQRTECEHKNHLRQVVTINSTPLINANGQFSGAVMVVRDETRLNTLEKNLKQRRQFHHIIGQNIQMQKIYSLIEDLADVPTTVLITGESGTGKELVAEAIHYKGKRSGKPMVTVNCAALSENLLESELFGHVKGAFTGADRDKTGRFQKADEGTIFLDEIGDISPRMQLKLLRVIQEKMFERVGDSTPIKVDVRVIAATNTDLSQRVKLGEFREDLYYRLKVVELSLPPLRERKDDILLLVDYFINKLNDKFDKHIVAISDEVRKAFIDYPWPGNIRELEHTLEHAFVITRDSTIIVDKLPDSFMNHFRRKTSSSSGENEIDQQAVIDALEKAGWNKSKAARILGVTVRTIYRKMDKYDIRTEKM